MCPTQRRTSAAACRQCGVDLTRGKSRPTQADIDPHLTYPLIPSLGLRLRYFTSSLFWLEACKTRLPALLCMSAVAWTGACLRGRIRSTPSRTMTWDANALGWHGGVNLKRHGAWVSNRKSRCRQVSLASLAGPSSMICWPILLFRDGLPELDWKEAISHSTTAALPLHAISMPTSCTRDDSRPHLVLLEPLVITSHHTPGLG
jgi:hypothetical protein